MKNLFRFILFILIIINIPKISFAISPDVFIQSTVNRASQVLSENISKEKK